MKTAHEAIAAMKAEVKRRLSHIEISDIRFPGTVEVEVVLKQLLAFLDTLEAEKPMEQEGFSKEFDEYFLPKNREQKGRWKFADIFSLARHFAEWGSRHAKTPTP